MSRFTEARLELTDLVQEGRPVVRLVTPLAYEVGFLGSAWSLTAPAGFLTDQASLPAWLCRTETGRWMRRRLARASIPHDLMRGDRRWPKLLGDYVFWEAMGVDRVPAWLRVLALLIVLMNARRDAPMRPLP